MRMHVVALFCVLFLLLSPAEMLVRASPGEETHGESHEGGDGERERDHEHERQYEFEVDGNQANIHAKSESGDSEDQLEFRIDVSSGSGPNIEVELQSETNSSEMEYRFRMRFLSITEYVPDDVAGLQHPDVDSNSGDEIVREYPQNGWDFENFMDYEFHYKEESESDNRDAPILEDRQFEVTTTDGVFTLRFTANPSPQDAGGLQIGLNDLKFDVDVDMDALKALGFVPDDTTELAFVGEIYAGTHVEHCDDDDGDEVEGQCVGDSNSGQQVGTVEWLNYLDCEGGEQPVLTSSSSFEAAGAAKRSESEDEKDSEHDGEHSKGGRSLVTWSLDSPSSLDGVCVWDPLVRINTSGASTVALSFVALVAFAMALI